MESVKIRPSGPDVELMFSDSEHTVEMMFSDSGRNTTDATSSSSELEASPAAVENSPTGKPKKKKKKGICGFFRRVGKAIKLPSLGCSEVDVVSTFPKCEPTDVQQDFGSSVSSESIMELMSVSDVWSLELPVNADPDAPEPSSLSGSSVLDPESTPDLVLMSVSDISSLELPVNGDPSILELMSVCSFDLLSESDPDDPEPPSSAADLELVSVSDISSLSSVELTPDSRQDDPDPSPVPSPSAPDFEIPDPSGLGTAFVFDLWFAESRTKKKKKTQKVMEKWRAIKRSFLGFQKSSKFADEPVANQDPADLEPLSVSSPSTLHSGRTSSAEKLTKKSVKKHISAFFQRTWRTMQVSALCCFGDDTVDPDPADLQPRISVLSWELPDPGTSYIECTCTCDPFPVSGPMYSESTCDTLPFSGPSTEDRADSVSFDSSLDPSLTGILSELSVILGSYSDDMTPVPSSSSVELADSEATPVPGASGLWSATGEFSSFYEVKSVLGTGGFGMVCEGTRRCDDQKVAIKFRPKKCWDTFINLPGSTKPLLMEVAVNLLMRKPQRSPHIVQMLDWFDEMEQFVLIMEYPHPCETLLEFSQRNGGFLDEAVARGLMRQAVLAVKHCVDRGVFHKDIKTDNMLVNTETLQLTLIDFGCCELFKTSEGREWAVKSSVWSLGRVLLEIASGSQPLTVLQFGKLDPLRATLSRECCDLIKQCLDSYQSKRPTLEQMIEHAWFQQD